MRLNWGKSNGDAVAATRLQTPFPGYTRAETALTRTATAGLNAYGSGWAHEARFNVSVHRGGVVAHAAAYGDAAPIPFTLLAPASSSETDTAFNVFLYPGPAGVILSGPLARTTQTQAQVTDTWSLTKGRHTWTMGVDFRQVWNAIDPPRDLFGYRFRECAGPARRETGASQHRSWRRGAGEHAAVVGVRGRYASTDATHVARARTPLRCAARSGRPHRTRTVDVRFRGASRDRAAEARASRCGRRR